MLHTDPFPCPGTAEALCLTPLPTDNWLFALSCDLSREPPIAQLLVGASLDHEGSFRWTRLDLSALKPDQHIAGMANFEALIVEAVDRDLSAKGVSQPEVKPIGRRANVV